MEKERQLMKEVYAAKTDGQKAEELIRAYIPFIRSEASKFMKRFCTQQDDEFSIAMMAFHEAVLGFSKERGAFTTYAALLIRSRLIDYQRREAKYRGNLSLDDQENNGEIALGDTVADRRDLLEEGANLEATQQEIAELSKVMAEFGVTLEDIAENSPKQARTLEACAGAIRFAGENTALLDELLRTKKLPLAQLVAGSGAERKTLERHRKYILAMLLVQTNGYEIIRGHLRHVLQKKGEGRL